MTWFLDLASQGTIFIGAIAMLFIGKGNRWGFVLGLLAQPAWFYTTVVHEQWVLLGACFVYAVGWGMGFYRTFLADKPYFKRLAARMRLKFLKFREKSVPN